MKRCKFLLLACILTFLTTKVFAATTPPSLVYEGRMLDRSSIPIASPVTLRFSLWTLEDWTTADTDGEGSIDTNSSTYGGWQEVHTVTPSALGVISVQLGSITPLPASMDWNIHRYLQVEVKSADEPDVRYQLLDPTGDAGTDATDRKLIASTAYAKNAETVDNRSVGTESGEILVLGEDGIIAPAHMGNATHAQEFSINALNTPGDTTLTFGNQIAAQMLAFSDAEQRFQFSDDVFITGSLSASGGLIIAGATALHSAVDVSGPTNFHDTVTMSNLPACDSIDTDSHGTLRCGSDATGTGGMDLSEGDERYINANGDSMNGTLDVRSTISASGPIATNDNLTINADNLEQDAILTFGNNLVPQALRFSSADQRFEFTRGVHVDGDFQAAGSFAAQTATISGLKNCDTVDTDENGTLICGEDAEGSAGGTISSGVHPPWSCDALHAGALWLATDTGMLYTCSFTGTRSKWLTTHDTALVGEQSHMCRSNGDIGNDDHCAMSMGSGLGAGINSDIGIYFPHAATITGYGFSSNNLTRACRLGGSFDIEAWSTSTPESDSIYHHAADIATGLTDESSHATSLGVDIDGDRYLLFGIDNNCRQAMHDWNLTLYYRWRHD